MDQNSTRWRARLARYNAWILTAARLVRGPSYTCGAFLSVAIARILPPPPLPRPSLVFPFNVVGGEEGAEG